MKETFKNRHTVESKSVESILLVDDDQVQLLMMEQALKKDFKVFKANNGRDAIRLARSIIPSAIVLDLNMPVQDGFETYQLLKHRPDTSGIPILAITASSDSQKWVKVFTVGFDDLIHKPFNNLELAARIRARLKNVSKSKKEQTIIAYKNLTLYIDTFQTKVNDKFIDLSRTEFELLKCLLINQDRVVTRSTILSSVWIDTVVSARTIDTHLVSLRRKLADVDCHIESVYGVGYKLREKNLELPKIT